MSFYYDDNATNVKNKNDNTTCPRCGGRDFYNNPVTGKLICGACNTQSQTETQEELDFNDGMDIAAQFANKKLARGQGSGGRRRIGRILSEYDKSKHLPDGESCCLAFQWLLWDASKCVSKLAGIQEGKEGHDNINSHDSDIVIFDYEDIEDRKNKKPSIMEQTVKKIWFTYLNVWMEATKEYSAKYPEIRVSFRDYFLDDIRKSHITRHLSVTIGKKVENEMLDEMQNEHFDGHNKSDDEEEAAAGQDLSALMKSGIEKLVNEDPASDGFLIPSKPKGKKKRKMRTPFLTIAQMCKWTIPANPKRHPNELYQLYPHQAVLKVQPSLTLLLAIIQLACNHLQTGVAPHHLTMWVANGQLPHALNGYTILPSKLKAKVEVLKKFFMRSYVPPANAIADLTNMLATACSWYENGNKKDGNKGDITPDSVLTSDKSSKSESAVNSNDSNADSSTTRLSVLCPNEKSLYNVPLLAARMVQDFGFDQRVLDNTMALMGVSNNDSEGKADKWDEYSVTSSVSIDFSNITDAQNSNNDSQSHEMPSPLSCASPDKLYSPLHVAAVIVMACKLCPGWESWKIVNLHSKAAQDKTGQCPAPPGSVPWNESQFQLFGNGPTLNHYLDVIEGTACSGVEPPPTKVKKFFQSLDKEMPPSKRKKHPRSRAKVTPNLILSGAPNPNEPTNASSSSLHALYHTVNNIGRYTSYQYRIKKNSKILSLEPYHPHYCRLLEYICYIIEEPSASKLHDLVEYYEEELLYR